MDRSAVLYLDLLVDGVRIGNDRGMACVRFSEANEPHSFAFTLLRDQLTPGERTFRMQWRVLSGNVTLFAAASSNDPPAFFWARALP